MTDSPLAALLDDLETRASLYHSSGGPHRGHYRADLTNARAAILAEFATLEADLKASRQLNEAYRVSEEKADAQYFALRAHLEGKMGELLLEVEAARAGLLHISDTMVLWIDRSQVEPGDKVRVTRLTGKVAP